VLTYNENTSPTYPPIVDNRNHTDIIHKYKYIYYVQFTPLKKLPSSNYNSEKSYIKWFIHTITLQIYLEVGMEIKVVASF